jgi:hypothetical protein
LVLYDAPKVKDHGKGGGANFSLGDFQMIVAMSANESHIFQGNGKKMLVIIDTLGPSSIAQLYVMFPIMNACGCNV